MRKYLLIFLMPLYQAILCQSDSLNSMTSPSEVKFFSLKKKNIPDSLSKFIANEVNVKLYWKGKPHYRIDDFSWRKVEYLCELKEYYCLCYIHHGRAGHYHFVFFSKDGKTVYNYATVVKIHNRKEFLDSLIQLEKTEISSHY